MACGLPAIATDWGAHTEYFSDHVGYPLRIRGLVPAPQDNRYYAGFSWADPDPEHLSSLMRHVFDHRDEASEIGRKAAVFVRDELSLNRSVKRMRTRLDEIAAERGFSRGAATLGSRAGGNHGSEPPTDG
jgi:glycosyltransferase involved in cell wall biosynthesis